MLSEDTAQDRLISFLSSQAGSRIAFWACFAIPLLAIPASVEAKLIVSIVFSNWYQAWALPAIKRSQDRAQALADSKATTDHIALTHIATQVDEILSRLPAPQPEPKGEKRW